ncbi:UNKNOWN [Stylonychia lemnae]|uniref:Uncharacterized protein n=1 Tax=Stylonychia lemnae TaxID=5949 RepID=A0A078A7E5_STYLE|nr:UNKNOWN [Stylonychia lemnae]|eukprot:CDW77467.1 UNKNOWN [Stylonychia lemnae]
MNKNLILTVSVIASLANANAHVKANQIGDHDDGFQNSHMTQAIQTLAAETLGGEYQRIYDFTSGFLFGSSYSENKECVKNLNSITYYGLFVLQGTQNFKFQNAVSINLNVNKFTEATGIFTSVCDINHMTKIFSELSTFEATPWVRMGSRAFGVAVGSIWAAQKDINQGIKDGNWYKVGKTSGKLFKELFDSAL